MDDTVDGAPSSPGVADPIQQRTDDVKYPAWQPKCRAVMLEIDPIKVKEKFAAAEAAMAKRLRQITESDGHAERRALQAEHEALELALDEILSQHPDLKK
jgi:hypothetical protein